MGKKTETFEDLLGRLLEEKVFSPEFCLELEKKIYATIEDLINCQEKVKGSNK